VRAVIAIAPSPPAATAPLHVAATDRLCRDLDAIAARVFDVLIIGGGIHGAWAALDAAQRGLSTALLEQSDFGSGASGNSQRIIHGGLRYLQHGHFARMRQSIGERRTLLRLAPHLVAPMPVLVPIVRGRRPGRLVMGCALAINDLLSADRNRGVSPDRAIGRGRMISAAECIAMAPALAGLSLSGGAIFYDARAASTERLLMAVIWRAAASGAIFANRVRIAGFARSGNRISGANAVDVESGETIECRARLVINCTGSWSGRLLASAGVQRAAERFPAFRAAVLVTRPLVRGFALAVPGRSAHRDSDELVTKGYRNYFITPANGSDDANLVGAFYRPAARNADAATLSAAEIDECVREFNESSPLALAREDVLHAYCGWLPADPSAAARGRLVYAKRSEIIDHERADGVSGLLTVLGVKWTTARLTASRAVDAAMRRLGRVAAPCRTAATPLDSSPMPGGDAAGDIVPELFEHLAGRYGSAWRRVIACARGAEDLLPLSPATLVTPAEVRHAALCEMALRLEDAIFRRLDLATGGHPGSDVLEGCARVMGSELGWDDDRRCEEIAAVNERFRAMGMPGVQP
jgi:glycerol-3-phosphate dehydrogenase